MLLAPSQLLSNFNYTESFPQNNIQLICCLCIKYGLNIWNLGGGIFFVFCHNLPSIFF